MRSPLKIAREVREKRFRAGLGPAIPLLLGGVVHHGWFAKWNGTVKAITACGEVECCKGRGSVSGEPVGCGKCLQKAEDDPGLMKGE